MSALLEVGPDFAHPVKRVGAFKPLSHSRQAEQHFIFMTIGFKQSTSVGVFHEIFQFLRQQGLVAAQDLAHFQIELQQFAG